MVAAKLNSVDFQEGGVTPEDAKELCQKLEELGLDFVELSGGTFENFGRMETTRPSTLEREGFFLEQVEALMRSMGSNSRPKTYVVGGLRSVEGMSKALKTADGVTLARPAASKPRLPTNIIEGGAAGAIRPFTTVEGNFGLSHSIARIQMSQIAKGKEPLGHHGSDVVERYAQDWERWAEKTPGGAGMTEGSITVNFSGVEAPYGDVEE